MCNIFKPLCRKCLSFLGLSFICSVLLYLFLLCCCCRRCCWCCCWSALNRMLWEFLHSAAAVAAVINCHTRRVNAYFVIIKCHVWWPHLPVCGGLSGWSRHTTDLVISSSCFCCSCSCSCISSAAHGAKFNDRRTACFFAHATSWFCFSVFIGNRVHACRKSICRKLYSS